MEEEIDFWLLLLQRQSSQGSGKWMNRIVGLQFTPANSFLIIIFLIFLIIAEFLYELIKRKFKVLLKTSLEQNKQCFKHFSLRLRIYTFLTNPQKKYKFNFCDTQSGFFVFKERNNKNWERIEHKTVRMLNYKIQSKICL